MRLLWRRLFRSYRGECMSADWLKEQLQRQRDEFHGVSWAWPIDKFTNEHPHEG